MEIEKILRECREELLKEMDTGELIYESLCPSCKIIAEKIIEDDGVINCWDEMLNKHHKDKQSEVQ
jgi:hypothetical protein